MYFDPLWLALMVVSTLIGFGAQLYINQTFNKWSNVPTLSGRSGAQVAETILRSNGLDSVGIQPVSGSLSDHYDPRSKVLGLSEPVYGQASVAAAGVAAHEAGHALQDAQGYVWGRVRSSLVPVAQFGSSAAIWLIILGVMLKFSGLATVGIIFYAGAVLFQIVTLPVEFDASRRAMASLEASGTMSVGELAGARQVLSAAALTYVAAALVAVLQLLYWLGVSRRS